MAPLIRRPARRLVLAAAVMVAGALTLAAAPATAAAGKGVPRGPAKLVVKTPAKAAAKAPAKAGPKAKAPLPVEGPTCLFPIPGQECSEEERRLCDAPSAPDPVVIDCHDPANAWVREMVGECDMPHFSDTTQPEPERDRPREGTCLDTESCGATGSAATPLGPSLDYQPAIDRVSAGDHLPALRLPVPPEIPRRHPGYARGIEHPPKA
jgi:hypothetical protein